MRPADDAVPRARSSAVLVFDGATGTNFQLDGASTPTTSAAPRSRGATRSSCVDRPDVVAAAAPLVPRRRRRRRRDELLRRLLGRPRRVRHRGPRARARDERAPRHRPARSPTSTRRRLAAIRRRLDGTGDEVPHARPDPLRRPERDRTRSSPYGLLEGGVDLLLVETMYDLLGGQGGDRRRATARWRRHGRARADPGPGDHRADRPDAAGHRDRRGDHRARPAGHRRAGPQLRDRARSRCTSRCATSRTPRRCRSAACPTPGCPASSTARCTTTSPETQLAEHLARFVTEYGVRAVGGCCGTTPAHLAAVGRRRARASTPAARDARARAGRRVDLHRRCPYRQDTSRAARRRAHQRQRVQEVPRGDARGRLGHLRRPSARDQIKEGAHILDVCVDYTGADGVADMDAADGRLATQSSVPLMVDTTEAPVARSALTWIGGKRAAQLASTSKRATAEGTRLDSFLTLAARVRRRGRRHLHRRGGPGAHRGVEGARGDARSSSSPSSATGSRAEDLFIDPLALPLSTGHGRVAPRRHRDDRGDPPDQGRAARRAHDPRALERLVRAQPRGAPGAQQRSSCTSAPRPASTRRSCTRAKILPLAQDRRARARGLPRPHLRPPPRGLRPAHRAPRALRGRRERSATTVDDLEGLDAQRAARAGASSTGSAPGSTGDLDEAIGEGSAPLDIVNDSCSRGCAWSATCSRAARCSCPSCCRAPRR